MSEDESTLPPSTEDEQLIPGLSWPQRVQGFLIFMSLGLFATVMSWFAIGMGQYWKYTVLSTMGSLMSSASTFVLMGPAAQLRLMFDEYRQGATVMYFGSLLLSLFVAFTFKSVFLCMLCGMLQYATLAWYSLSYVPYGREAVASFISQWIS